MSKTIAVIGSGIAGLASAIRLANKAYKVNIFEANAYAGGKLSQIENQGFRFDAGPSLFTMPHLIDELFELSGKNPKDYFDYKKLDVVCKYFYEDKTIINAYADFDKFTKEINTKTGESEATISKFLKKSKLKYDLTADVFLHRSLHQAKNYFNKSTIKGILNFYKLDVFRSLDKTNRSYFKDERLVQFFNRYATYNGSDPYQTPGIMNIIPHLEFGFGAFFPKGGMYAITQSLVKLAQDLGVKIHYSLPIKEIIIQNKTAVGLKTKDNKDIFFDKIVSNMDIVNTYNKLLPTVKKPQKLLTQPKSSSALIFYWGIQKQFPELELHNIFFSKNYKKEFEYLFQKQNKVYEDPTVYINISSKENPQDAPENCENWFTMVNVPNNTGQNWDKIITDTRENIIQKLSSLLQVDLKPLIVCEDILDPRLIESRTSSSQGALYGNSSNNKFAAFLRHANFSNKIKNLYFCGGSVHPGGGIPLSVLSAKIMADFV